ncbi:MAG: hypothetical protein NTY19_25235 [Planctomycetota bacterium]|nr:hypothetical protein [Planctomycetota bacterium]
MKPDAEGLHPIANTDKADRSADIVFVHGLGGCSHSTWRHGKEGKPGHFFWPQELGRSLPLCGVWTIGYAAGITELGSPGMIIEKRAGNIASQLAMWNIGERPVVFIAHSMGGLVVKSLIVSSQLTMDERRKRLVRNIRGIVFCGTPHRGSAFASAAGVLGKFLGGSQPHVKEMEANAEPLDLLHDHFLAWHQACSIPIETYAEGIGLFRKRWLGRPVPLGLVVPRTSANPGVGIIRDVDADHLALVKPSPAVPVIYDLVHRGVQRFIDEALNSTPPSVPQTPAALRSPIAVAVPETRPPTPSRIPAEISRIVKYAPAELVGREDETQLLADAWDRVVRGEKSRPHVLTFVALGGEGKTALVAKWAAELAGQDWPGCEATFAWSFYSQGTREQMAASSDLFLKEALVFFGDDEDKQFAGSSAGPFEKGQRLARIVGQRRCLLILDGLEPLQYAPTAPTPGELKDQGVAALLKGLAASSRGLCAVTTRYSLPELTGFGKEIVLEVNLQRLSRAAGVDLLQRRGVRKESGSRDEFENLVEDVKGHALTLNLLGAFLKRAFHGDIRQRNRVKFEKADEKIDGGHAFRTMAAYEQWLLRDGGDEGQREVAVLQLMGLFDRPADVGCLVALRSQPIPGLTGPLAALTSMPEAIVRQAVLLGA